MSHRLNHYLALCGVCSRRGADRLIQEGRVRVNGETAFPGVKVEDGDTVPLDGRELRPVEERLVIAVNKPAGVVCTEATFPGERTLSQMVDAGTRVFSVGRLDKDSEGLILMTNDGALAREISLGENGHEKEYEVTVDRPVTDGLVTALRRGVTIEIDGRERTTLPCRVKKTGQASFDIILTQGMNRQIRRMCEALGFRVRSLRRVRIMNILLGDLQAGSWRLLTPGEIDGLFGRQDRPGSFGGR